MLLSTRMKRARKEALNYNTPGAITDFYHETGKWVDEVREREQKTKLLLQELQHFTSVVNDILERFDYEEISDIYEKEEE